MFRRLRAKCAEHDIAFHLVFGQPSVADGRRQDSGSLEWATPVRNTYMRAGGVDVVWQATPRESIEADLVVLPQENRILSNYVRQLRPRPRQRVAYFGHGVNFQSKSPTGLRERWKQLWANRVDWWFAYTEMSAEQIRAGGFDGERISVLNNAVDMDALREDAIAVTGQQMAALRAEHRIEDDAPIAVFCGAMYPDKKLDLMFAACARVKERVPGFHLVLLGDGPSAGDARVAADKHDWVSYLGMTTGPAKAAWYRLASIMLNPGTVGLHILDAFAMGLPLVSTANALHSPEVAYARDGQNAVLVPEDSAQAYADAIVALLEHGDYRRRVSAAALNDADKYTLDAMVERFVVGFQGCLAAPPLIAR